MRTVFITLLLSALSVCLYAGSPKDKAGIGISYLAGKAEIDDFSFSGSMIGTYNENELKSAPKFACVYETMFPFLNSEYFLIETKLTFTSLAFRFDHVFEAAVLQEYEQPVDNFKYKYTLYNIYENVEYDLSVLTIDALFKYDIGASGFQLLIGPSIGLLIEDAPLIETEQKEKIFSYESQVLDDYVLFDSLYFQNGKRIIHDGSGIDVLNGFFFNIIYGMQYELNISGFIISPFIYFSWCPFNIAKNNEWFLRSGQTGIEFLIEL